MEVTLTLKDPRTEANLTADQRQQMALPVEHNEVAALYETMTVPAQPLLYVKLNGRTVAVSNQHPLRDSLVFPVIYPHSYRGWCPGDPHVPQFATNINNKVTMNQHAR